MPKKEKAGKVDFLNQNLDQKEVGVSRRGYSHRYGENIKENNTRQKEQSDRQIKSEQAEKNRRLGIEEEEKNRKFRNDEISEETADRVYNKEPREKQLKEQEEQESAAAKKFADQKIDTSESEISKEEVIIDTLNSINDNISMSCKYLSGEDLARTSRFENCMKIFGEAVSSGRIVMDKEQAGEFAAFGKRDKVVDEASAKDYVDFAFTKVLPFVASIALVAGIVLGVEQPLSGLSKINNLLNTPASNINNLGDNLLR